MVGSTSFFLKRYCSETIHSGRFVWRESEIVRPKTAEDRTVLLSFLKYFKTLVTQSSMTSVSGSVRILLLVTPRMCRYCCTELARNFRQALRYSKCSPTCHQQLPCCQCKPK